MSQTFPPGSLAEAEFREAALGCLEGLYGFALTLTRERSAAEDLVQETYVRAMAARRKAAPDENLRSWLFVILHNVWRNELRRRRTEAHEEELDRLASPEDLNEALDQKIAGARLQEAIEALPGNFRAVLVLRAVEGFSYREIARILGCPAGTVMSRLARARILLRRALRPVALDSRKQQTTR